MIVHELKILPVFFDSVAEGEKTFELRRNDRGFLVGDYLKLREWSELPGYSGRELLVKVTYMTVDFVGLEDGYCILGIRRAE